MNKKFQKKTRQINILKKQLLDSGLVTIDIINDAEKLYNDIPYHNFLHALRVSSYVLLLNKNRFSPLEIRSLIVAGLFHDAGHTGDVTTLDEFISLDYFRYTMDKYPDFLIDDSICRAGIIGTVFKNRSSNINKYAKIMADLDIGDLAFGIEEFLYYGSLYSLELGKDPLFFYTEIEKGYFKFLMGINKYIIISPEVREVLPNALSTIKEYYKIDINKKIEIYNTLINEDITLDEFKYKFFKCKKK